MAYKRRTDKERKRIIADYVDCGSYSQVAKKHKMSVNGVKKIVLSDEDSATKCKLKKEQNSRDMEAYLQSKLENAYTFIDMAMEGMTDKEKIANAPLNQIATAMGIMIDKFTKSNPDVSSLNVTILNDIGKKDGNSKT